MFLKRKRAGKGHKKQSQRLAKNVLGTWRKEGFLWTLTGQKFKLIFLFSGANDLNSEKEVFTNPLLTAMFPILLPLKRTCLAHLSKSHAWKNEFWKPWTYLTPPLLNTSCVLGLSHKLLRLQKLNENNFLTCQKLCASRISTVFSWSFHEQKSQALQSHDVFYISSRGYQTHFCGIPNRMNPQTLARSTISTTWI